MSYKRYIFKSGLDIIAPLKCGTRWLNEFNIKERIDMLQFASYDEELAQNIHSDITFIWRPVREHFISAIQTEWTLSPNKDIWDIITEMEFGTCFHWYPYLYKKLYPLWLKFGFKFYKLRALSQLTPSASEHKWTSNLYKMHFPIEHITVEEALKSLSPEQSIKIQNLISEEENWLKLMIKSQYSQKTGEDYSNLEDSMLETKCKVMDLEDNFLKIKCNVMDLEDKVLSLENMALKMKDHNTKIKRYNIELKDKVVELENKLITFKKTLI
jgi:hypothetical protein